MECNVETVELLAAKLLNTVLEEFPPISSCLPGLELLGKQSLRPGNASRAGLHGFAHAPSTFMTICGPCHMCALLGRIDFGVDEVLRLRGFQHLLRGDFNVGFVDVDLQQF